MIFSVLLSSVLLLASASATSSSASKQHEASSSEARSYSAGQAATAYEPREPETVYSKAGRGYESSEDGSTSQEDYAQPKAPAKKTVILAIPVKLALQQSEKAATSYESSGESYTGGSRASYPASYSSYADQAGRVEAGTGATSSQYEAASPIQNSQITYQQAPTYTASATHGYAQSSPVSYVPARESAERPLRTYSDKSPPPKPYQPDNDVDHSPPTPSYSSAPAYEYTPKARPYTPASESSYEIEEHPRPRKTHKRPAAYVEESVDEDNYSRPSPAHIPTKYIPAEPESDSYPGLDGATGYQQELSDIVKTTSSHLPSYGSDSLDDADYTSSLSSLGLQSYSSPSLPQSELSYLMSKMPRGFSPVPAASSYGLDLPSAPRLRPYPFGLPSRGARRPYAPSPYAPSPYLKGPHFPGSAYPVAPPASKLYLPAASFRSYSSTPYYGAASSPVPATSPFRLSSAVTSGLSLGKSFGSGKGLRIGPLEFGASGSLFPSIKIKSPVRV